MVSFFLNFPMFYHCAIKDHTSLSQYDAVSILLLGKSKADCRRKTISDYRAVYYTLGMERLPSDILTSLLQLQPRRAAAKIPASSITGVRLHQLRTRPLDPACGKYRQDKACHTGDKNQ